MPEPISGPAGQTFCAIIPTLNAAQTIRNTVESLLRQGPSLREIVIVDGGSTDGTTAIARRLGSRIKVVDAPGSSIYEAMNRGIAESSGAILYFIGAGDTLRSGAFAAVAPAFEKGASLVYGDVFLARDRRVYAGQVSRARLCYNNICQQATFYSRPLFEGMGTFDTSYKIAADYEFNLRAFSSKGASIQYVPIVVADFEQGGASDQADLFFESRRFDLIKRHYGSIGIAYYAYYYWREHGPKSTGRMAKTRIFTRQSA